MTDFRVKANIITQRHECFQMTIKYLTLNDLEMPLYAEICCYRRYGYFSASLLETTVCEKRMKIIP